MSSSRSLFSPLPVHVPRRKHQRRQCQGGEEEKEADSQPHRRRREKRVRWHDLTGYVREDDTCDSTDSASSLSSVVVHSIDDPSSSSSSASVADEHGKPTWKRRRNGDDHNYQPAAVSNPVPSETACDSLPNALYSVEHVQTALNIVTRHISEKLTADQDERAQVLRVLRETACTYLNEDHGRMLLMSFDVLFTALIIVDRAGKRLKELDKVWRANLKIFFFALLFLANKVVADDASEEFRVKDAIDFVAFDTVGMHYKARDNTNRSIKDAVVKTEKSIIEVVEWRLHVTVEDMVAAAAERGFVWPIQNVTEYP